MSSNSVFPPASETVLVVENETAIRNLVQMALERHGYHILAAESGADALRVADGHRGRIDLLALFTGAKTETVKQAKQVGVLVAVVDAVVHEGSQRKGL